MLRIFYPLRRPISTLVAFWNFNRLNGGCATLEGADKAALWPAWVGAIGSVLLAILAVFQDRIRGWITRPRLQLGVKVAPPNCHKTAWSHPFPVGHPSYRSEETEYLPCYYFRLAISNTGNAPANNVEVFAASLERKRADGGYEPVGRFTPMNLLWAHEHKIYLSLLTPKMCKFCDLGHVVHPNDRHKVNHELPGVPSGRCVLAFDLQVEPNMKGHLAEPGTYRLTVLLAAENSRPREYRLESVLAGEWYDSEEEMLRNGFGMRML